MTVYLDVHVCIQSVVLLFNALSHMIGTLKNHVIYYHYYCYFCCYYYFP